MAVPTNAGLVQRLVDRLAQRDADVLDGVVRIDLQIAVGNDVDIDQAVARHLFEHVLEERQAGLHVECTGAVKVH